jgi:5'-deoxynucleotidase YfbR-like HD superfamily hydrolase
MSADTILSMADGCWWDLLDPAPSQVNFTAFAEHLAKEARYNGATPDQFYSVAQHAVLCADAALDETGDALLAAYLLLHDNHEAVLKDDTTPKKRAIAAMAASHFGILAADILKVFDLLTERQDLAIHIAAGLPWPAAGKIQQMIKHYDKRAFVTEWRDLMGNRPHPDAGAYRHVKPFERTIAPLPWQLAKGLYLDRAQALLPALQEDA